MDTSAAKLIECNVIMVFRELRFGQILNELARRLLPDYPTPLITEVPGQVLAVVFPDKRIQCQFANLQVRVTDTRGVAVADHGKAD